MQNRPNTPQPHRITVGDVYYALFRQKWKIIFFSLAGVLAATILFLVKGPLFQSEAKLLIRYVLDNKTLSAPVADSKVREPDERGVNIINTEVEILTSFDLAQQVVETVGAEQILAKWGGGQDRNRAALLVSKNLTVEVPNNSSVIRIVFQHPDPEVVRPVLSQLIERYLKKHVDIHQAIGVMDDFLRQETDQLKSQLSQTEEELQKARETAGVLSLTDTKKVYTEQVSKIRQELFDAEAELVARQAALKDITNLAASSASATSSNPTAVGPEMAVQPMAEYKSLCGRLDVLWKRQQDLLTQFTEESALVKEVREQIAQTEMLKRKLEGQNPLLANLTSTSTTVTARQSEPTTNPSIELARVAILKSKIQVLSSQLDQLRTEAVSTAASEARIQELQRKKELEEENYRHFSASLERSRFDEALGAGKISNISVIQAPSPPTKVKSKIYKMMALAILLGVYGGLGVAFLIEWKLDQSVKRPSDVETTLHLPLFLSIPQMDTNGQHGLLEPDRHEPPLLNGGQEASTTADGGEASQEGRAPALTLWSRSPALRRFYEALRDRLIVDFETRKLTHKPKLIAVTSCGRGSGVTTVATGLAACLSETGDGNVLLVDMSQEKAAAQQFCNGESVCGLTDALYDRNRAQVQDNLYVVTERTNGDSRPRNLPQLFTNLVPKLKASNYDYIIFDMPPINQTSVTPRLAGFMDQVMIVIESEKTDRELVREASALLAESKASVCAVLNKTRAYVPARLHQSFLSDH